MTYTVVIETGPGAAAAARAESAKAAAETSATAAAASETAADASETAAADSATSAATSATSAAASAASAATSASESAASAAGAVDVVEAAVGLTTGFTKVEIEGGAATDIVFPLAITAALVAENGQIHVSGATDRFTVSGATITPAYPWAAGTIVALGFQASNLTELQIDGTFGLPGTVGGTANAVTVAIDSSVTALVTGLEFTIWPSVTNTGAVTMNVNGLGAVAAKTVTGAAMPAGYLRVGKPTRCWYDGTQVIVDRLPENGSTPTGVYRRYADGKQECTYTMTGVDVTTAVGGIYKSAPQTWEFPMPFVYSASAGEVFLSGRLYSNVGMGVNVPYGNRTTQADGILAYATASVTGTSIHLSATGPWY